MRIGKYVFGERHTVIWLNTVRVMVDAVNTSISAVAATNAVTTRVAREQSASSRDVQTARQAETQKVEPILAPYISPAIHVDINYNKAVIQIRDSETGDVQETIPSESDLARKAPIEESRQKSTADDVSASLREVGAAPSKAPQIIESDATVASQLTATESSQVQQATAEQVAAFEAAARSGDTNAGAVSIFA